MSPGIHYAVPMADYLKEKAVGAGIVTTLLSRCPKAAWWESPWNPAYVPEQADAADAGTVAHSILLEGHSDMVQVFDPADYPNARGEGVATGWSNKAIRTARDEARAAGKIPVLASQMAEIEAMANAAREFIASLKDSEPAIWRAFYEGGGDSELTLIWDDDNVPCRIRPDRMSRDAPLIVDWKFVTTSAEPDTWGRSMLRDQRYVGAAFYRRGVQRTMGVENCTYVYGVTEQAPPHLTSLVGVDEHAMAIGEAKVDFALKVWRECMKQGKWAGYPARVAFPEVPAWLEAEWEAQQIEGAA